MQDVWRHEYVGESRISFLVTRMQINSISWIVALLEWIHRIEFKSHVVIHFRGSHGKSRSASSEVSG